MMRSDLPQLALDARHLGQVIAHPCNCGAHGCTIGTHIWRTTQEMAPGPKAQTTEPRVRGWAPDTDHEPPADPTIALHLEHRRLAAEAWRAIRAYLDHLDRHRPDRTVPLPELPESELWCTPCRRIGEIAPRFRGDLCRWHYDFGRTFRLDDQLLLTEPIADLARLHHDGKRINDRDAAAAVREARRLANAKRGRKRKRKAS